MFGFGTSAGFTLTVFATRPPTPPAAAFSRVIPSRDVGPAAVRIGFLNLSPRSSTLRSAIMPIYTFININHSLESTNGEFHESF